jgi:hypothetical protein
MEIFIRVVAQPLKEVEDKGLYGVGHRAPVDWRESLDIASFDT